MHRHALPWLLASLLLIAVSCGSGKDSEIQGSNGPVVLDSPPLNEPALQGMPELPAISELQRQASEPADYAGYWITSSVSSSIIPARNVLGGTFTPNYDPEMGLFQPAYSAYRFYTPPELGGNVPLTLNWLDSGPEPGSCFVAVANFSSGRWEWHAMTGRSVDIGELAELKDGFGSVNVLVLLTGTEFHGLNTLVIGEPPPYLYARTDLDEDPTMNIGPLTVTFDASFSEVLVHPIAGYDFDFDGDGTYEEIGDADGIESHLYGPGNYSAVVRVNDTEGNSDTVSLDFLIIDPENSPPVASFISDVISGVAPLTVSFDPSGSSDLDGEIIEYRWDFTDDGEPDVVTSTDESVQWNFDQYGFNTVELTVVDNNLAENYISAPIEVTAGWRSAVIESGLNLKGEPDLARIGAGSAARIGLAYFDGSSNDLVFRLSANTEGSAWNNRRYPVGQDISYDNKARLDIVRHGSLFRIAYDRMNTDTLAFEIHIVRSFTDTGELWDASDKVSGSENVRLAEIGAVDNILYIGGIVNQWNFGQPMSAVCYAATDNDATGWEAAVTALALPAGDSIYELDCGNWNPASGLSAAMLVDSQQAGVRQQQLLRTTNLFLGSWLDPVAVSEVQISGSDLAFNGSVPLLVYGQPFGWPLLGAKAQNQDATDWSVAASQIGDLAGDNPQFYSGNHFYICYYDIARGGVAVVRSTSSGDSWDAPQLVAYGDGIANAPRMSGADGNLTVVYYDGSSQTLNCCWYE
ncbi:MAG: hypothetical protein H7A35_05325 [Planctomycetales bacterium]|nr:PKD domain-containing protein [bacterium]UNM09478.1 MAG: hypothetical protein H7A35_05325 [Planctomycetales bacterium]